MHNRDDTPARPDPARPPALMPRKAWLAMAAFFFIVTALALRERDVEDALSSAALTIFAAFFAAGQPNEGFWRLLVWSGVALIVIKLVGSFAGWF